ncbi:MAG TPA: TPM domain-containing protein [Armatimonadota bacterium]|jgi:uncharacterized protein
MNRTRLRAIPRWILPLLLSLVALACGRPADAQQETPFPKTSSYVDDFAQALSPQDISRLGPLCRDLDRRTGYQMLIVTVASLNGEDINHAATRYLNEKGAGRKGEDTGIVIMRAVAEKRTFIATGKGTEAIITDAFAGDVFRNTIRPLTRQGRLGDGLYAGAVRLRDRILEQTGHAAEVPHSRGGAAPSYPPSGSFPSSPGVPFSPGFPAIFGLLPFLFVGFFVLIVIAAIKGGAAMRKCPRCGAYLEVRDEIVQPPGFFSNGYGMRTRTCPACGFADQRQYTIPRSSGGGFYGGGFGSGGGSGWNGSNSGGFSGGDSGFSGGGWGGGSSGGGSGGFGGGGDAGGFVGGGGESDGGGAGGSD